MIGKEALITVATKETFTYEALWAQVELLSPEQQVRLIFALAKQLSPGFQTKLIVMLLPDVAPTIEAVLHNQVARPTSGTSPENAARLLKQWCEENEIDGVWTPITRYDNAHHFVHRDDLKPDGTQIKTPPMAFVNNEEAFNFALRDLRMNYRLYSERYLRWKKS